MCGIAGLVDLQGIAVERTDVERMVATLEHRGPDGAGTCASGEAALGHRRLAIVDLEGGAQPMQVDGITLSANAEIYNHRALRAELEARGHRFRTHCDVEVIAHGYRAWGRRVVERLNGMFAFAIWDAPRRRLLLARDRLGQKPLYYADAAHRFAFASEPKAILTALGRAAGVEPEALARYLLFDFVPAPWCIFRGVHKLPAAHWLELDLERGSRRVEPYWQLPVVEQPPPSLDEACERVRELFDRALDERLMSDVPMGLLLSGGFDSTLVGASLARRGARLQTFSIGFHEPAFDEAPAARAVADWLGTRHHERRFDAAGLGAMLPKIIEGLDEPLADPSLLAVHALARLTREHVKVALGGDGADELFGGYDVFVAGQLERFTRGIGPVRDAALARLLALVPARQRHFSLDFRLRQLLRGLGHDERLRALCFTMNLEPDELRALCPSLGAVDPLAEARAAAAPYVRGGLDADLRVFELLFLESDILVKIDRAGMAHGVEIRSPFFDHRLVEYVARLPGSFKVHGLSRKWILRRALGERVPRFVRRRSKHGFSLPIVEWINRDLSRWFEDALLDPQGYADGLLERAEVERLLQSHRRGQRNLRKPLWNLALFMHWKSRWLRPGT